MDSISYWQHVTVHRDRQFITGQEPKSGIFLPESVYSQALDTLVVGCVDIIPVYYGHMLIGLRTWEPQLDWWCFGGRMHKGELYQIAATRNVKRELFHSVDKIEIDPSRFVLVGVYNLIWDKRAQELVENGCHMISVTMMLPLTDTEFASLHPNEEYQDIHWVLPDEIIHKPDTYHPCLLQMAKYLVKKECIC